MKIQGKILRLILFAALAMFAGAGPAPAQRVRSSIVEASLGGILVASPVWLASAPDKRTVNKFDAQAPDTSAKSQPAPGNDSDTVWVNTAKGVYHRPNSRWYGKTKKGKYMLEADAIKAGYKPAKEK